jgi:hypothetical protein
VKARGFNLKTVSLRCQGQQCAPAVGEKEIDLLATHEDLVEVEKQIREATAKHNAYLRELGLPGLPLSEG